MIIRSIITVLRSIQKFTTHGVKNMKEALMQKLYVIEASSWINFKKLKCVVLCAGEG